MKSNWMIIYVLLFCFSYMLPASSDGVPAITKRGGIPYEDRWNKKDVWEYLDFPILDSGDATTGLSADTIQSKLESLENISRFGIQKYATQEVYVSGRIRPPIEMEIADEKGSEYRVGVFGVRLWNPLCQQIFEDITNSVSLWNSIPKHYEKKVSKGVYSLTRKGQKPQKWYFSLEGHYVIYIDGSSARDAGLSESEIVAEMNNIMEGLVSVIDQ